MKALRLFSTMLLISLIAASCEEAKDLGEINLGFSLTETFPATNFSGTIDQSTTFSATDNAKIEADLNNIKGYTVEKVTIKLENLVEAPEKTPSLDKLDVIIKGEKVEISTTISGPVDLASLQSQGEIDITQDAGVISDI